MLKLILASYVSDLLDMHLASSALAVDVIQVGVAGLLLRKSSQTPLVMITNDP